MTCLLKLPPLTSNANNLILSTQNSTSNEKDCTNSSKSSKRKYEEFEINEILKLQESNNRNKIIKETESKHTQSHFPFEFGISQDDQNHNQSGDLFWTQQQKIENAMNLEVYSKVVDVSRHILCNSKTDYRNVFSPLVITKRRSKKRVYTTNAMLNRILILEQYSLVDPCFYFENICIESNNLPHKNIENNSRSNSIETPLKFKDLTCLSTDTSLVSNVGETN